jgi:hypothetical protein
LVYTTGLSSLSVNGECLNASKYYFKQWALEKIAKVHVCGNTLNQALEIFKAKNFINKVLNEKINVLPARAATN